MDWTAWRARKRHLFREFLLHAVIPAAEAHRDKELTLLEDLNDAPSASGPAPAGVAAASPKHAILIGMDGERNGLQSAMEVMVDLYDELPDQRKSIGLLKWSAACSKTQQPLDVGPLFRVSKQLKSKYEHEKVQRAHHYSVHVRKCLAPLDPKSRNLYCNFLDMLPQIISQAFTEHNIRQGWEVAGIWPFNATKMLGQCPTLRKLKPAQVNAFLAAIPKLAVHIKHFGQLTDAQLQAAVGTAFTFETPNEVDLSGRKHRRKALHEMVINRRRALLISHPTILRARAAVEAAGIDGSDDDSVCQEIFDIHPDSCLGRRKCKFLPTTSSAWPPADQEGCSDAGECKQAA